MRVCVVDPSLFTLAYDHHLCAALHEAGAEVTLCGRALREGESLAGPEYRFEPRCYRWTERGQRSGPRGIGAWLKAAEHTARLAPLFRHLRSEFDVLHFQWSPMPAVDRHLWRRLARDRGVVFTVHDTTPFLGRPTSRFQQVGWRTLLDVADALIVHTQASRQTLIGLGVPAEKVNVVAHGPLQPHAAAQKTRPHTRGGRRTILVFGEIKPYKGIDVLLRALGRIPEEIARGWQLVIAGRPRCDVRELQILASEARVPVEWRLGFVPDGDVDPLFRGADIVAFPYRQIDASGALMLALPFGAPVVASRVGIFGELLEDGVTAMLTRPGDVDDLARALEQLMRDEALRARLRVNVLDRVKRIWSWDAIARSHLAIYRRCVGGAAARVDAAAPAQGAPDAYAAGPTKR